MNFARHFIAWQQKSLRTYVHRRRSQAMLRLVIVGDQHSASPLHLDARRLPELPDVAATRRVQPGLDCDDCGFVTPGLCRVADVRADGHPDAVLLLRAIPARRAAASRCSARSCCSGRRSANCSCSSTRQAVTPVKIGGQVVANKIVFAVLAFVVLYFGTVVTLTFMLLASGMDFISSFTASHRDASTTRARASASSARPATTRDSPTSRPGSARWRCCSGAWRSFPMLVLLTPTFWRK